ncbi:MAG: cyanophycinase [Bacteroidetes bacterium]|nr:cyanophycinase [Bacteroidota bacterium]
MRLLKPKGTLIPIGGGEDKEDKKDVLARVVSETGRKKPKVCLITLATNLPKEVAQDYRNAFKTLNINTLSIIYFNTRTEADSAQNLKKIKDCHVVLFSGGDQLKLSSLLGGTKLLAKIRQRYYDEPDFVIAGTSAGAAAMSNTMIISGSSQDALIKGELELTNGLDLINSVFIDTHFTQRGRFGRLIQTVTCNPGILGVGLGEDTAIVIHKGEELEVIGSGLVIIVDGTCIDYTDLTEISDGHPITVEGIKMHVLGPGKRFLINDRKIVKFVDKKEE